MKNKGEGGRMVRAKKMPHGMGQNAPWKRTPSGNTLKYELHTKLNRQNNTI